MTPAIANEEVREYLDAVRARLDDLEPEAREHLLSDTEASLLEAAEDGVALPLEVRLGPPERFARELRAAAGLPEPEPEKSRGRLARLAAHPRVVAARESARELAPVWWVARGFLALTFLAQLAGDDWSIRFPLLTRVLGNPVGWLLLVAFVAGSIALGRRERRAAGRWPVATRAALGIVSVSALAAMAASAQTPSPAELAEPLPVQGLAWDGRTIGNVYAYDRRGRLLQDIRLYDELGTPLDVRRNERGVRRVVADRSGERVFNSFPIRYYEPGTQRVRRPRAGVLRRRPPGIVTPPVRTPSP